MTTNSLVVYSYDLQFVVAIVDSNVYKSYHIGIVMIGL